MKFSCLTTSGVACALWLYPCLCLAAEAGAATAETSSRARPQAHVYTNADLERVSRYRDQTGVASVASSTTREADSGSKDRSRRGGRGRRSRDVMAGASLDDDAAARQREETYWRREATQHAQRQRRLAERIVALQRQAERGRRKGAGASARDQVREQILTLEQLRRDEDDAFEDRARRAGALPGWLR